MIAETQLAPDALLDHARRLIGDDDLGTPEQALDLRRAASSAYYAVFHELCWQAAAQVSGCPPGARPPALVLEHLVRWFSHRAVADACREVSRLARVEPDERWADHNVEAWHVLGGGEGEGPPEHLRELAEQIGNLRDLRTEADYNPLALLDHGDVIDAVANAENVIALLREHARTPAYRGFFVLVAMSARARMRRLV